MAEFFLFKFGLYDANFASAFQHNNIPVHMGVLPAGEI
jgi:hypothetical protein